ncbi:hypothetical protein DDN58_17105 [Vibrio cholerae]|nr:hypothetical protein [Vibrio cholerae]
MHRTLQYKKKAIQQTHLDNLHSVLPFEAALYEIAQEEQKPISKIALKRKGISPESVDALYSYYIEEKHARIELNCSIAQKMQWKAKAEKAQITLSKLVTEALNNARVYIPVPNFEQEAIKEILKMQSQLNAHTNQIAKWCNTHKQGVESISVLAELNEIRNQVLNIDDQLMRIMDNSQRHYSTRRSNNYQDESIHDILSRSNEDEIDLSTVEFEEDF